MFPKLRHRIAEWLRATFVSEASSAQITNANLKNFIVKFAGAVDSDGTSYDSSEYDLSEIKDAINTDSYLKVACTKYSQLVMKSGYQITSVNEDAVTYIKQRIRAMEFGTGIPFDMLMNGIAQDLVPYSNAFLIKSRVDKIANNLEAKGVLSQKPVGGYFRADPTTITIKRSSDGSITGYQQEVGSTTKTYKPEDVIHFYADKEAGNAFGTPRISPALEDVKILRKVEGNTLSLLYRFALPLYQMKIGLAKENFMATDKEIQEAQNQIEKMPMDGIIITNERTEFHTVGAEGTAVDMVPYLQYYENRVFSALNVSQSMMGRGGAKQDADSMEQQIHDQVKYYQHIMETFIERAMFDELLLEGGYDPIFTEDDQVTFSFNEISLDTKIKLENHITTQFQGNMLTFEEARRQMGLLSDQIDTSRLYANMITQTNAKELLQMKLDQAQAAAEKAAEAAEETAANGNLTNGKIASDTTPNQDAQNKDQPANQYGTTSAKVNESLHLSESREDREKAYRKNYARIYKKYRGLRNSIGSKTDYNEAWNQIEADLKAYAADEAGHGVLAAYIYHHKKQDDDNAIPLAAIEKRIHDGVTKLRDDISARLSDHQGEEDAALSVLEYRMRFFCEYIVQKAYWYGFVVTAGKLGTPEVSIQFHSDEDKEAHKANVKTKNVSIDDIPPFHAYCKCTVGLTKRGI